MIAFKEHDAMTSTTDYHSIITPSGVMYVWPFPDAADRESLALLTRLRSLLVFDRNFSDLTLLAYFTGLRGLSLSRTKVSDIGPLASLTELEWLHLRRTNVSDLTPLAGLTRLRGLDLSDTNVSAEAVGELRRGLPDLEIYQ